MLTLGIAGVGLIGGSLGLALRRRGFNGQILGVSSPRTIEVALERGAIDEGVSLAEAAAAADILVLAQPVSVILRTIGELAPVLRPNCLVTDAGSTKVRITEAARVAGLPRFVGGHPMAGKEQAGIRSADPDLFVERPWILTTPEDVLAGTLRGGELIECLKRCGAVPVYFSPEDHDRAVAWTSHLPQLASTALGASLSSQLTVEQMVAASGQGLRDMTRLGMSPWDLWRDILDTNSENIQHALSVYIDKLTELRDNLQTQRTGEAFTIAAGTAKNIRRGLTRS